jgi:prolipoprotein diacylglyceryl transferase
MYATISDLLQELLGIYIPLPIQTFGFFMAISFMLAFMATSAELKRKESEGLLHGVKRKITRHSRVTISDYAISMLIGAIAGYKLLYIILNYSDLVADPQAMILSPTGNIFGAVVGGGIAWYLKKKEDDEARKHTPEAVVVDMQPHELMGNILGIAAIAGLLGAKVFHNLENLDEFASDPLGALVSFSGLTFYGGLIVAAVAVLYYTGRNGIPHLQMIDATAPGLMLAYGVGRIGCHLSGDGDWGIVNTQPKPASLGFLPDWVWSFRYPHNVLSEGIPIPGCDGRHCNQLELPVYPTPLYEAVAGILLFLFLWNIRKHIRVPGMLFCIYLVVNGIERFLIEKIRVNNTYDIFGNAVTQAELISSLMVLAGIGGLVYLLRKRSSTLALF